MGGGWVGVKTLLFRIYQYTVTFFLDSPTYKKNTQCLFEPHASQVENVSCIACSDKDEFNEELPEYLKQLSADGEVTRILQDKNTWRNKDWQRLIEGHRKFELANMRQCFQSQSFLRAMSDFVYKRNTSIKIDKQQSMTG